MQDRLIKIAVVGAFVALAIGCQDVETSAAQPQVDTQSFPANPDAWVGEIDLATIERREFTVAVNPALTIEQMVALGAYDYANPDVSTANFAQFRAITGTAPVVRKVVAFRVGRETTLGQAKKLRDRLKLKAIGIDDQVTIGAQHQDAQRKLGWIVNMDSVAIINGLPHVPVLYGYDAFRYLNLLHVRYEWRDDTWFFGLSE